MRRTFVSLCVLHAVSPLAFAEPEPLNDPRQIELQALSITGSADGPVDGPVDGYKANRSASATRTDTALHDTPQSISVVPKDVLEDTGATRLQGQPGKVFAALRRQHQDGHFAALLAQALDDFQPS